VAVGVAHALSYLHGNDNSHPVIHRDVKSSNIIISELFEPKVILFCLIAFNASVPLQISYLCELNFFNILMQLSDFGLAVWAADVTSQMTCNDVAGTFGCVI
jgi:serine/threonine protein kinase